MACFSLFHIIVNSICLGWGLMVVQNKHYLGMWKIVNNIFHFFHKKIHQAIKNNYKLNNSVEKNYL